MRARPSRSTRPSSRRIAWRRDAVRPAATSRSELSTRILVNSAGLHASGWRAGSRDLHPTMTPETRYARGHYFVLNGRRPSRISSIPRPHAQGSAYISRSISPGRRGSGPMSSGWTRSNTAWIRPGAKDSTRRSGRTGPACRPRAQPRLFRHPPEDLRAGRSRPDFRIDGPEDAWHAGLVNLFGIESPGLTASLAIADEVSGSLGGTPERSMSPRADSAKRLASCARGRILLHPDHHARCRALRVDHGDTGEAGSIWRPGSLATGFALADGHAVHQPGERRNAALRLHHQGRGLRLSQRETEVDAGAIGRVGDLQARLAAAAIVLGASCRTCRSGGGRVAVLAKSASRGAGSAPARPQAARRRRTGWGRRSGGRSGRERPRRRDARSRPPTV